MHRLFDPTPRRWRRELDGRWSFVTDPDDEGVDMGYFDDFPADADRIDVPGTWNTVARYHDYEGPAWYRRTFDLPEGGPTRLSFQGVCHDATVWIDGDRVADHYGGYTPFEVSERLDAGQHDVVVRADNTRDEESIPRPGTDWFPYGGITREAVVESLPPVSVSDVAVAYELDDDRADVRVEVTVHNDGQATERAATANVGDATAERTLELVPGTTTAAFELSLDIDRWSPEDPQLYEVRATVGEDERRERVGFRTVEVTDTALLVNGEQVDVRGVNRHEDHPEWGHAQPLRVQELDLDVIEDAGLNAVRTSHYPNHPRFLDLCDERGVLVIEEIPYWQFDAERFRRGDVLDRGATMLEEMIERDRNHPSILAWSVTNECANEEPGVLEATEELVSVARTLDDRPVTLASNNYHPDGEGADPCLDLVDFVCANAYPGWYSDGEYADVLRGVREDHPDKPVVVSEFGAGAVAGERTREDQKWSEGFQADFLADAVETFRGAEYVAGFTVWQYCDTRTDPRNWERRPKTKNNKGVVDEYRRPKAAYRRLADLLDGP
ncbi:MAG: glycoside hydrolase family 2 protein [Haloarculaceae archaeon]